MRTVRGPDRAELERMVDVLERIHAEGPGATEERLRALEAAGQGPERLYDEAARHFTRHERTLREQSAVAARLIAGLRERQVSSVQRLLRLAGPAGSTVGGRFRVQNEADAATELCFAPRFDLPCSFAPATVRLGPGEDAAVDVRIEPGTAFAAGETATLLVDVLADGIARMKLWVEIALDPAEA